MKTLILSLAVLLFSVSTYAVDTSGCGSMVTKSKGASTVSGNYLQVETLNAYKASCYYAKDGRVTVSYVWNQTTNITPAVSFWVKLNGVNLSLETSSFAYVTCNEVSGDIYSHDTSGNKTYRCVGQASFGTGYQEKLNVEVAPVIDGKWDTQGYSQNYNFQF